MGGERKTEKGGHELREHEGKSTTIVISLQSEEIKLTFASQLRPLPECPLNRLAVSKQFYEEAAPTFLRAATLRIEDVDSFDHFVGHMPVSLLPFITTVHINSLGFGKGFAPLKKLSACSGIRELRLAIEDVGAIWYSWYTWSNNTAYFERLRSIKYLLAAESLRSVTLVAGRRVLVLDGAGNLQKNIAALNKVVALKLQARSSPDYGEQPESTAWHTDSSSLRRSKRVKLSEGTQGCETPGASGVAELTYSFT